MDTGKTTKNVKYNVQCLRIWSFGEYQASSIMGEYSSKISLFFLNFAISPCFKILYISSFFPTFSAKNKKWFILGKLVNMGNLQEILTENWLIRNSNFWWIFYPCATHFKFRYFSLKSPKIPSFSWGKGKISTYPHSPMFPIHQNTCWTSLLLRPVNQHPS